MADPSVRPYGSWISPISATRAATGPSSRMQALVSDGFAYWTENRPTEGGRVALLRKAPGAPPEEATPSGFNCRTRVHEYGGAAFVPIGDTVYAVEFKEQRLYRIEAGSDPVPITPEPAVPAGLRYADGRPTPDGNWIVSIRESHQPGAEVSNEIVILRTNGAVPPRTLVSGRDFYAAPRLSPDGRWLAWLEWDHPQMPWDGTELWMAELASGISLRNPRRLAGGPSESILQPEWSPSGVLHFVSDRSGWWNLYRWEGDQARALLPLEAEFGSPAWGLGFSHYVSLPDGRIATLYTQGGIDRLGWLHPERRQLTPIETGFSSFSPPALHFDPSSGRLVFVAAAPDRFPGVYALEVETGDVVLLSASPPEAPDPQLISRPRPLSFPTGDGASAHALYYPPHNPQYRAPPGERPPLIVLSHGGPTSRATAELSLPLQFWTSRGFAVVDVNYRGSTGHGRHYREQLNGMWGVRDVQDCLAAADYLIEQGEVDPARLIIRGGSAGGYTTLCALTFHSRFAAGASYFGVADLESLARETHKFESRYLDRLIGPYPEAIELYRQRSPLRFADRLSCPLILFQGMDDQVVPPAQAETMVAALRDNRLPHAYLTFEGEGHGFRLADNIARALEAELYFYGQVFGIELADPVEPIEIVNLPGPSSGSR